MIKNFQNKSLRLNILILLNVIFILTFFFFSFTNTVNAVIGEPNATVQTQLNVGSVFPEVLNVSIENGASSYSLTPNSTKILTCTVRVRDFNGDSDLANVTAEFFDTSSSSFGDSDDNNEHYTNNTCALYTTGTWGGHSDDEYTAVANCTFALEYYANPSTWNCSATVNDTYNLKGNGNDSITISQLLAIGLPDNINYGIVNATAVSLENQTNITNAGNVLFNISLEGYAQTEGDGLAMNCSLGSNGTIPVGFEKFNLTISNPGEETLTQFNNNYTNLTADSVIREFKVPQRQNDTYNEAINSTYWRIYVPMGVAGNCTGNIIFGATLSPGT
jgi:hypothetical protein